MHSRIKTRHVAVALLVFVSLKSFSQQNAHQIAKTLIVQSMQAMGAGWDSVKTMSLDGYGYQNQIDESERPEGPYIPIQIQRNILIDIAHNTSQVVQTTQSYIFGVTDTTVFNGDEIATKAGGAFVASQNGVELRDELNLSPEIALKKALGSPHLTYLKDTIYQKANHSIVSFRDKGFPVRIFLNKETSLISAIEITKPFNQDFSGIWGDIKKTIIYSFWMVLSKGIHYPLQQDCYLNNYYKTSFLVDKWKINPAINSEALQIPEDVKEQSKQLVGKQNEAFKQQVEKGGKEIAPGIWFINGLCNTTVVEQPDGIVVIESAFSSFYSDLIIAKVHTVIPGKKIKALVSTSDAWLHIGGMRSFAAIAGIKIYHPVRNLPLLKKLLKAPYKTEPDVLAKTANPSYTLNGITDTLAVGTGSNKMVMYSYKTETGDRQMMVYFPQHKLLYTSDLYQGKYKGDYWNKQIVWEVYHSIKTRKIDVQHFYAMHSRNLLDFKDLEKDVLADMQ